MAATDSQSSSSVERPSGPWKDERRSPGYLPQGRRAPFALLALVIVGTFGRLVIHHLGHTVLGILVIMIGLSGFWTAWRMDQQHLEEQRYARGPGWFIGLLISKTSVPVARTIFVLMSVGICALGALGLAAR